MHNYVDFTYDKQNFSDLPNFIDQYRNDFKMKFIQIIDAGISADYNNNTSDPNHAEYNYYYKRAEETNSLIMNISDQPLLA